MNDRGGRKDLWGYRYGGSFYVVNALKVLEVDGVIKTSSTVAELFCKIQDCLLSRQHPFFITHVRAHSGLPGLWLRGMI